MSQMTNVKLEQFPYSDAAKKALARKPQLFIDGEWVDSTGGATVVVLESEEEVERRNAKVYCEVASWGQASDGHNVAISHPEGTGLRVAMENALKAADLTPDAIDYVNRPVTLTVVPEGKRDLMVTGVVQ